MNHTGRRWPDPRAASGWEPSDPALDVALTAPSPARVYDHLLGGKDNYEADRALAERMLRIQPHLALAARQNRAFVARAVHRLARAGFTQFLDIGCGLPVPDNVHQIAARARPGARVVYADNDPIVLAHGRALLAQGGNSAVVPGDLRDPGQVLRRARDSLLDFRQPVAVLLTDVLHFLPDADRPHEAVARLRRELPDGSALILSHLTADTDAAATTEAARLFGAEATCPLVPRSRTEIAAFFGDLTLVAPGLVFTGQWCSSSMPRFPEHSLLYAGVACSHPLPDPPADPADRPRPAGRLGLVPPPS